MDTDKAKASSFLSMTNRIWETTQTNHNSDLPGCLYHGIFDKQFHAYVTRFLAERRAATYNVQCDCAAEGARPHVHVIWSARDDIRKALKKKLGQLAPELRALGSSKSGKQRKRATYNKLITSRAQLACTLLYIQCKYAAGRATGDYHRAKHYAHTSKQLATMDTDREKKRVLHELRMLDSDIDAEMDRDAAAFAEKMAAVRARKGARSTTSADLASPDVNHMPIVAGFE